MGITVGIDLGTSNSVVAWYNDGKAEALADSEGRIIHPSVVAFGYGDSVVVGHRAKQQLTFAPENTVFSAKRLIGRRFKETEVQRMRKLTSWGITDGNAGDARVRVQGKIYAIPEVSAHVLRHMKKVAEDALGQTVDSAVITVPAYFNDQQRQATRDAAEIAGLKCLRIINEPTAAALAYGHGQQKTQHLAIYDLGGGTFDISILRVDGDFYEVLSTAGDTFLGGDDFDMAITDHMIQHVLKDSKVDLSRRYVAKSKLREAAEEAKMALSQTPGIELNIPNLSRTREGRPIHFQMQLDRLTLKRLCMPLIQRTFLVVDDALKQAGLTAMQIDSCLLVGGMTRSPLIREAVGHYFGKAPIVNFNPDEIVALGAAIQADNLSRDNSSSVLVDVTPQSLGIRTAGGFVRKLIDRNTSIPTETSDIFYPASDNQTEVRIKVFQGESNEAKDNAFLGEFVLDDIQAGKRSEIPIRVSFAINADGIVKVKAKNMETGKESDMMVEASSALSQDEVNALKFNEELTAFLEDE